METQHNETILEKAAHFVKDALGINDTPPEVREDRDFANTRPEAAAEAAMNPDPNPFIVNVEGQVMTGRTDIPAADRSAERPIDRPGSEPMAAD